MTTNDPDVVLDDDKKKTRKLQVWVGEELFEKILGRARATNRHTSAWLRALIEKHFRDAEDKKTKEDGVLDRLERLLTKLKA